jgi:hypothetical protein
MVDGRWLMVDGRWLMLSEMKSRSDREKMEDENEWANNGNCKRKRQRTKWIK